MPRSVTLVGGSPWGFRLVGGCDFHACLAISKVTPGGKAEQAGLKPQDVILSINNQDAQQLTHLDAQNVVRKSTNQLTLQIESENSPRLGSSSNSLPAQQPKSFTSVATPKFLPSSNAPAKTWQPVSSKPVKKAPEPEPSFPPPPPSNSFLNNQSSRKQGSNYDDSLPPPPTVTVPVTNTGSASQELTCEGCKQQIRGPYLTAQGKNWHPEEFVCSSPNCGRTLQNIGFIEEEGQRYCSNCYEKYFAHSCAECHKKIVGEVMHALNQTWHVTCFVCTECKKPFRDGVFHLEHDKPYCVSDYNQKFSTKCKGCDFAIEAGDHYVEAIKSQWHEACFTCTVCHIDLKNAGFFAVNDRPVCANHKNATLR